MEEFEVCPFCGFEYCECIDDLELDDDDEGEDLDEIC